MDLIASLTNIQRLLVVILGIVLIALSIFLVITRDNPGRQANRVAGSLIALIPAGIGIAGLASVLAPDLVRFLIPGIG